MVKVQWPDRHKGGGRAREFHINVKETLEMQVTVEADTVEEALKIAEENWRNGEYILDYGHFGGVEFEEVRLKYDGIPRGD